MTNGTLCSNLRITMKVKDLVSKIEISARHIHYILSGERKASASLALQLEKITGIDRRAWLWPEEFHNPMIKTQGFEKPNANQDQQAESN